MGDIYPYGHPHRYDRSQVFYWIASFPGRHPDADTFAAIAQAESSLDPNVINDTPATGDYSVGLWQVNYFGTLYAGRAAAYGTPGQLVADGLGRQAAAAVSIWRVQGYTAWSTWTSGAYRKYLTGAGGGGGNTGGEGSAGPVDTFISPPTEDYSDTIWSAADRVTAANQAFLDGATALRRLKDGNPRG